MKRLAKSGISFLLCLSVLLSAFAYRPQKADAIAITGTAAVVASVAAIMTACGVTYWAATEQDAIDYLGGKIEDYLTAAGSTASNAMEWLGIDSMSELFTVIQGGSLSFPRLISNKVFDFIRWFNQEEGVESDGEAISSGGLNVAAINYNTTPQGVISTSLNGDVLTMALDRYGASNFYYTIVIPLALQAGESVTVTIVSNTISGTSPTSRIRWDVRSVADTSSKFEPTGTQYLNSQSSITYTASSSMSYLGLGFNTGRDLFSGSCSFRLAGVQSTTVVITPSALVSVPSDLEVGQSLVVTTTAPINTDDDVEAASEAILGEIASQDGLDATNATEGEAVPSAWTWLYNVVRGLADTVENILDVIRGIPAAIAQAIAGLFIPDRTYLETYVASLTNIFEGRVGILTFPLTLVYHFLGRFAQLADGDSDHVLRWGNINEPFSGRQIIAAGSYDLDDAVSGSTAMTNAYSIYMVVVRAMIVLWFAELCRKKYEKVIAR